VNIKVIKILFLLGAALYVGNIVSGTLMFYLFTHHLKTVSPFLYVMSFIHLDANAKALHIMMVSGLAGILSIGIMILLFLPKTIPNIYGKARFANFNDIKKAKLFSNKGIYIGRKWGKYLQIDGYEHITLFSPTGTGKSVGLAIPNLMGWEDSCVVMDIKLQLFHLTSRYRQDALKNQVFLFNPASPDGMTHCYNPLDVIGQNPYTRIDEIQKIAAIFIPDNPKVEPIWIAQSRFLFVALTLYVLDTSDIPKNIPEVIHVFKSKPNFIEFLQDVLQTRLDLDPVCRFNFMKFCELHEKTRVSIIASFSSYFELFDNPLIAGSTSRSDFTIQDLRRKKMTIYVGVTNDNLVRLSPLLTVFYQQVADVLTRKTPAADEPFGVLFLMDEFSALRRMESFHKNIGLYREYKMRMVIIIQELSQLYDTYGRDGAKVFINAKVRIAYTQNDDETCKLLELLMGNTTLAVKQRSRPTSSIIFMNNKDSESIHYTSRPLMLAQDIRLLPESDQIILMQGHPPIYAKKITWYKQKPFKDRMMGEAHIQSILSEIDKIQKKQKEAIHLVTSIKHANNEPLDNLI
jgi:type IV secretion system protein VirD4